MSGEKQLQTIGSNLKSGFGSIAKNLSKNSDAVAIQAVDLLTEPEIYELKKLASLSSDEASQYVSNCTQDPIIRGIYLQLSDLGFIHCTTDFGKQFIFHGLSPKANWAINRYDRKVEAEKLKAKELKRQRRSDRLFSLFSLIVGWSLGLATPLITALITAFISQLS